MEVKPGYKQTDVGVVPQEWVVSELEKAARVIDSLHQTPTFVSDGYPMVRVSDIKTGDLSFAETLRVTEAVFFEFTRNYRPKRGDIVLSRVGSYRVSSFVETDEPFCMGQNTVVLQPKLPSRFLYYTLNSRAITQQIEDGSYGSGYKSLSLKNIKELRLPVPPHRS
jgi:type I restriction enzyme S subunit